MTRDVLTSCALALDPCILPARRPQPTGTPGSRDRRRQAQRDALRGRDALGVRQTNRQIAQVVFVTSELPRTTRQAPMRSSGSAPGPALRLPSDIAPGRTTTVGCAGLKTGCARMTSSPTAGPVLCATFTKVADPPCASSTIVVGDVMLGAATLAAAIPAVAMTAAAAAAVMVAPLRKRFVPFNMLPPGVVCLTCRPLFAVAAGMAVSL